MSNNLRAGIIGLGILGSEYARFLGARTGVEVVAVADVRPEAAERVAAEAGATAYTDYRDMLRHHALDLAVVATPDPLHREPALAALEAGVPNLILEKPLATIVEEAEAICEAVEKRGARLFVNYANRANPLDVASRYVIQEGLLGRVVYGEVRLDDNICVPRQLWGGRSREWAAGSSTAHFLLSHVVDLLRWYFAPAEVREVYAISQREVLGHTPDVYDAFLTFDSGLKVRVKAEWIKHIDELVEFYLCFSGSEGTLVYNKRAGFGTAPGWRANLRRSVTAEELLTHQEALLGRGANVGALLHRPDPMAGRPAGGSPERAPALEFRGLGGQTLMSLVGYLVDAILEGTLTPQSWRHNGPLPTHLDGLKQTQVVAAIIRSAETGRVVEV
ncbi:MAG: Gfo/Idh/MocA family oxidoreductase [Anaerolineae bacterium]|nr:Gfo/Idh/MocA family oxidoreductase [Anaerolineae bacterium]